LQFNQGADLNMTPTVALEDLSKEVLLRQLRSGAATSTFLQAMHSHGATNYPLWLSQCAPYSVDYTLWYEPYFVINMSQWKGINGRGLFDEIFSFGLGDKAQAAYEAATLGHHFVVHPFAYIIHVPTWVWQSSPCDTLSLPSVFCDVLGVENDRHPPSPVVDFWHTFRQNISDFIVRLPTS